MERVHAGAQTAAMRGLDELRVRGVAPRIWVMDSAPVFEMFFHFPDLPTASVPVTEQGIEEPVLRVGEYCGWSRAREETPPGRPVVVGVESGTLWMPGPPGPAVLSWDAATLEELGAALVQARRDAADAHPYEDEALFQHFVPEMARIEPRLTDPARTGVYFWRRYLEEVAEYDLGEDGYAFPWRLGAPTGSGA